MRRTRNARRTTGVPGLSLNSVLILSNQPGPPHIPPVELAVAFEIVVGSVMEQILKSLGESDSLAAQRNEWLPGLVSGEVRVGRVEHAIEVAN